MRRLIESATRGERPKKWQVLFWIWMQMDAPLSSRRYAMFLLHAAAQTSGMRGFAEFIRIPTLDSQDLISFAVHAMIRGYPDGEIKSDEADIKE